MPTSGTLKPPVPHAKPIIKDDTVAALTGASGWPNVTLTGSVDCRKNPPTASIDDERPARQQRRDNEERHDEHERQRDDAPRPEPIGQRPAEEAADAAGEQVERDGRARLRRATAAPRQHHRHERREESAVSVRSTTMR